MKNTFLKLSIFTFLFASIIACKAQQTYPLNTDYFNIPNYSYLKDLDNELAPYVGTYKANYQGNEITLFITKIDNRLEERTTKNFYRDALVVKYIVKNASTGAVLQDTYNFISTKNEFYSIGTKPIINTVIFYYSGTNCGVGWGRIFMKKINFTQISWTYRPSSRVLMDDTCPGNPDLTVYLPDTDDLIFTKQ